MYFKYSILALFIALSGAGQALSEPVKVVASIFPFADVAKRIGGEFAEVDVLLKPGRDPHSYEPTPGDARKIAKADMVLMAGYGLDDWILKLVESLGHEGQVVINLSRIVHDPLKSGKEDAHGNVNPHYWLDPKNMIHVSGAIANALIKANPEKKKEFIQRMRAYAKKLKSLNLEIGKILGGKGIGKNYVSLHNAWAYFARRYGLNEIGVIKKSPDGQPSARHIIRLIKKIKKEKVKAILIDDKSAPGVSQTIATEAGVRLISVDPIGGTPGRESYIKLMRFNAMRFKEALLMQDKN